jgi:hypothetical protein
MGKLFSSIWRKRWGIAAVFAGKAGSCLSRPRAVQIASLQLSLNA